MTEDRRISAELTACDFWNGLGHLPPHMHDAVIAYFVERQRPGDFLSAVLQNDLAGAIVRADEVNFARLREWARFLHNFTPPGSCGSRENFDAWLKGPAA